MSETGDLLIRNVEIDGRSGMDVRTRNGIIAELGQIAASDTPVLDGKGGALTPGLHDHHIHLLALAAERVSIHVGPDRASGKAQLENILRAAAQASPGQFLRATQYHDSVAGPLDRASLDLLSPNSPLRVQYRTGSLWVLNSAALALVLPHGDWPDCVERDEAGHPTGRIWRGDEWLRTRLDDAPAPDLSTIGAELAQCGVTGVTDTSVTTGASEAALFAQARQSGALPQHLTLMSGGELAASIAYSVGAVKILLDDHALGDMEPILAKMLQARAWKRNIAVHCVTAAELAFTLAAFNQAGTRAGDRIEHGGVIYDEALHEIQRLGLTVVTQPSFISERGDIYLSEVDPSDLPFLYRCAALLEAGIPLAASTDAPYTSADPWAAMAAAIERRSKSGMLLGGSERIAAKAAFSLFLGKADNPGGSPRRVAVGEAADLCLLHMPLAEALLKPHRDNVAATIIAGRPVYQAQ